MLTNKTVSALLLSAVILILAPSTIFFEKTEAKTWQERLVIPHFNNQISRHTPIVFNGTYLPVTINNNITLSPQEGPYIITDTTTISPQATLTIEPGTTLVFHEFATLNTLGKLEAIGTRIKPIIFTSNEKHPSNKTWGGIIFKNNSSGNLAYVNIFDSSPAISCLDNSKINIDSSQITRGLLGVFATSPNCSFKNSKIQGVRNGLVLIKTKIQTENNLITASKKDLLIFNK